ncbi:MAG: oligosaccharide flippase family protein [bacterium]
MLDSLKRLTKHSAIYGIGHFVTRFIGFLLLPLHTNQLATDEYGVAGVGFTFLALMTIIYTYGIDAAFLRFFVLSDDPKRRRQIFSTAFVAVFVSAAGFSTLIYFFALPISRLIISEGDHSQIVRLTSLILLFDSLAFLPFLFLRAEEKSAQFVALKFINVIINVSLNVYYIVYLKKGAEGIFLANAWASAITFIFLLPILFRQISLKFYWSELKELLQFGLPYLPSTLAVVALDLVDRFILERMAGLEVTGIYNAGYKLGIFMNLYVSAFRFAWHPFFLSTSKQENAKEVFSKVLTYFTTLGAGIFLIISFFIDEIVRFKIFGITLFGSDYWVGTKVVPIILVSYLIYGLYVNFIVGVYLEKKTQYLPFVTGMGAFVNIVANILLIPKYGMMGSAYATLLGYGVMSVSLFFFAQKFYAIPYEFGRLIKLVAVVAVIFYVGYNYQQFWAMVVKFAHLLGFAGIFTDVVLNKSWEITIKIVLLFGFPVSLYFTGFFEPREMEAFKGLLWRTSR